MYGPQGSGQTYLGPALLHHLEGFHVQTFDLATLMSDSTRTTEAAIVQLFVEAKRHQPSVIFIPSLAQWSSTVSEIARATTRALLDGIPPSDPVLLLGIVDGPLASLPTDVRAWFGFDTDSRIELGTPERSQRVEFFAELLASVERKPTDFPDGVPRKRRVLEVLPLAEPLPPRQPTQAEIDREIERDNAARAMITLSFTSLLSDFARKFRRPVAMAKEAAMAYAVYMAEQAAAPAATITAVDAEVDAVLPAITIEAAANGEGAGTALMEVSGEEPIAQLAIVPPTAAAFPDSQMSDIVVETFVSTEPRLVPAAAVPPPEPITAEGSVQPEAAPNATSGADADAAPAIEAHNVDIDYMQQKLVKHKYYTPVDFLADIALIEANSKFMTGPEQLKVFDMCAQAQLHVQTFDAKWNPEFERYAQRMRARKAERKAKRDKEKAEAEAKEKEREEKERQEREQQQANGEAGAEATDAADSADTPNGLKRTREDGEPVEGEPAEKRAREDAMDVDPIESVQPATQQSTAESIQSFPTQPKGATPAVHESTPVPAKEPTPPPRTPTPPPVYPPLQVPGPQLAELSAILADDTGALTVDELEQLRAMLLDCVWRHRTSWDRASLVAEMGRRAALFIAEAGKMRELERLEREREQSHAYGF